MLRKCSSANGSGPKCAQAAPRGLRSAEWRHPQPRSSRMHVQARPPTRAVASSTIAERRLAASRRAAAMPAAPAPIIATSEVDPVFGTMA